MKIKYFHYVFLRKKFLLNPRKPQSQRNNARDKNQRGGHANHNFYNFHTISSLTTVVAIRYILLRGNIKKRIFDGRIFR
jgi:hypothetical protein